MRHALSQARFNLRFALYYADWDIMELWTAAMAMLWGTWLLLPFDTFDSSLAYVPMQFVGHVVARDAELPWGMAMLGLGTLQLYGYLRGWLRMRCRTAFGIGMLWTFVASCFIYYNWRTTATVAIPLYAVAALGVYSRLRANVVLRKKAGASG